MIEARPSYLHIRRHAFTEMRPVSNQDPDVPSPECTSVPTDASLPLESLMRDSGAAVIVIDSMLRISAINEAASDLSGLPASAQLGQPLAELLPGAIVDERRGLIDRLIQGGPALRSLEVLFGTVLVGTYRWIAADPTVSGPQVLIMLRPVRSSDEYRRLRNDPVVRTLQHVHLGSLAVLSLREFQILRMVGLGMSTAEMAKAVHRSAKTIEFHRMTLGAKLKVSNRVDLARIAFERRLTCLSNQELEDLLKQCELADDDSRE